MAEPQVNYDALATQHGGTARDVAPPPSQGSWEDRGIGGQVWHPATPQAGTERSREDNSLFGLPPEMAVMGGVGVARAVGGAGIGLAARTAAAIKAAASEAAPVAKYEIAHHTLKFAGVPEAVAIPLAMVISGYRRGAKGAATEAATTETAAAETAPAEVAAATAPAKVETPLELTRRLKAENQARIAATSPAGTAAGETAPPAGPPPESVPAVPPAKSPQQLLNEEAIARRRLEYQARQAAAPPAAAPVAKPMMTAAEVKEYLRLRVSGKTDQQARDAILAGRAMNEQFGLSVPTEKQTRFPKGMRGKSTGPGEP